MIIYTHHYRSASDQENRASGCLREKSSRSPKRHVLPSMNCVLHCRFIDYVLSRSENITGRPRKKQRNIMQKVSTSSRNVAGSDRRD